MDRESHMKREKIEYYEEIARRIRIDIIKAVYNAGSGHPGGSLSSADLNEEIGRASCREIV